MNCVILNGNQYKGKLLKEHIFSKLRTSIPQWESSVYNFLKEWLYGNAKILLTTSGSTGKPRTISVHKQKMIESALRTIEFFKLKPNLSALLCLPTEYIAGKMMTVRAIVGQMNLITIEPSGFPLQSINCTIDFAALTPMQLFNELKIKNNEKLKFLRKVIIGGAPVSSELTSLLQKQPFEAYETYGMTETVSHIALKKLNGNHKQNTFYPLKEIKMSLDKNNCLIIEHNNKDKIVTHDVGEIFTDGSFVINGRIDNVINSGGIKIFPEKIESIISEIINQEVYVSSTPHPILCEQAVLVADSPIENIQYLFSELKKRLNKYEMPSNLYQIDKFPKTRTEKIEREELKRILQKLSLMRYENK